MRCVVYQARVGQQGRGFAVCARMRVLMWRMFMPSWLRCPFRMGHNVLVGFCACRLHRGAPGNVLKG